MYQCNVRFYILGLKKNCIKEAIKSMPPMKNFSYNFVEGETVDTSIVANSDVIFAHVDSSNDKTALSSLISCKNENSELILLSEAEDISAFEEYFENINDIWRLPMTRSEIKFHIQKWQLDYKASKDRWENDQFFDAVINNTPNLIWFKSKDGVHEKVNNSFCRVVNKTRQQICGQRHAYIWDVEHDDPACLESEMDVMKTRETHIAEETVKTKDGTMLLTTYKSPLYDLDGSVMGTVGVGVDITQERKYKLDLEKKNITLETLFMSLDCGIISHSLDGKRIISVNSAALKLLDYKDEAEMIEKNFNVVPAYIFGEDKDRISESIAKLKKEGDSVSLEYRLMHRNGDILHIMENVKLVKKYGKFFYQCFLLDNTANKLNENKIKEEFEKHQADLVKALSIDFNLVCYFDLLTGKGSILRVDDIHNHSLAELFSGDVTLKQSMNQYIDKYVHKEDRETMLQLTDSEYIKKQLSESNPLFVNYRIYNGDEPIYCQVKVVGFGNWKEGKSADIVIGFHSVDDDVRNDMKQKALLQDALLQANRASKAKSVFLSNMSHDIRTPMNAIVGFTALAASHIDNKEKVQEYLKKIMTSGNHLVSLINDILDMSRIESGKMRLDERYCSLPEILHGLRNILHADITAKQMELNIDAVDIFNEKIYCDNLRLNQVLLNLLSNSVKYTPAGGTVSLRIIEKRGAPSGYANYEFHIKDTGIGMSREFIEHIFEPFERERNSTISGIQGTGLGMAITKNIVDMMNGNIHIDSKQGVGTEVIVNFTFRISADIPESPVIDDLKDCRALVVDDDFNTCDSVSGMLQQIGMRPDWTLSGKEAVLRTKQLLNRNEKYSVYIIDWLLPDMNGIEVIRRIRKEIGDDVPVIVLTAYDWADIEEDAKDVGVTAFCEKPLFMSELSNCLRSVLSNGSNEETKEHKEKILRTGRILLTEDNFLNQEIAEAILTEAGFDVDIAENGRVAVDTIFEAEPNYYQAVLMDVQMPVMNGYEATKLIRAMDDKNKASIPIIAMTANAFDEDKQEALEIGMNGHIAKPIDVDKLLEVLDEFLNSSDNKQ